MAKVTWAEVASGLNFSPENDQTIWLKCRQKFLVYREPPSSITANLIWYIKQDIKKERLVMVVGTATGALQSNWSLFFSDPSWKNYHVSLWNVTWSYSMSHDIVLRHMIASYVTWSYNEGNTQSQYVIEEGRSKTWGYPHSRFTGLCYCSVRNPVTDWITDGKYSET